MRCVICKVGRSRPGLATVTLQRGQTTVVIKEVRGEVWEECGEHYLAPGVASGVYARAEDAVGRLVELEIFKYAA